MMNPKYFKIIKTYGSSLDSWHNMLFFGDNLKVLEKLLHDKNISGKITLIYIDPPFSTNNIFKSGERTATISSSYEDEIAYEDILKGEKYLYFLRERLYLLKDLLDERGSIYVHTDYKIGHYVKILMDEVFGKQNFINDITRIKSNPKNFERKAFGNIKDMILFYSKTKDFIWNNPTRTFSKEDIERRFTKIDRDGRRYTTVPLHAPGETLNGNTGKAWKGLLPPKGRHWRSSVEKLEDLDKAGLIEWSKNGVPRKKIYADEYSKRGMKIQDVWNFKDPQYPSYPTEKNLDMLKLIIRASSREKDIVMDAFAGSGTTLVAAELLDRRWIGIDNSITAIATTIKKLLELQGSKHAIKKFSVYALEEAELKDVYKVLE
ncbi:MAG: site-specific DNA-methyltransferase [Candidatus Micrarchaeaceae archaeon]